MNLALPKIFSLYETKINRNS